MKKEIRVYVLSADQVSGISGYDIDEWNGYEERNEPLPDKAKEFIHIAENEGSVYSLKGFMSNYNIDQSIGMNDWIFITQAY